jgi:hypothetical protein
MAARSKAWTLFVRSNSGIVCSNQTQGMDICVLLFYVCVVLCVGRGLATGWFPVQGGLPSVYKIRILKRRPRSTKKDCRVIDKSILNNMTTFRWGIEQFIVDIAMFCCSLCVSYMCNNLTCCVTKASFAFELVPAPQLILNHSESVVRLCFYCECGRLRGCDWLYIWLANGSRQ